MRAYAGVRKIPVTNYCNFNFMSILGVISNFKQHLSYYSNRHFATFFLVHDDLESCGIILKILPGFNGQLWKKIGTPGHPGFYATL